MRPATNLLASQLAYTQQSLLILSVTSVYNPIFRISIFLAAISQDLYHYNDVILGAIASQITCLNIDYSTLYSGADQRKFQNSASLAFVRGIHRWDEFPLQMASNVEYVSIWWREHGYLATNEKKAWKMIVPCEIWLQRMHIVIVVSIAAFIHMLLWLCAR